MAASGEDCETDGEIMCASCDNGYKLRLRNDKTACDGIGLVAWERALYLLHARSEL